MVNKVYYSLLLICIVANAIRATYKILKHKKTIVASRISFIIIFINMIFLWSSWFGLVAAEGSTIYVGSLISYFGLLLCLLGVIMFLIALATIKSLEIYNGELITSGIYSRIRHPMYLSFILWLIGFPIYEGALFSFCISFVFISNVLFWRYLEELELEKRF